MDFSVKLLGFSWNLECLFWMLYISNNKVYNNENIFFFLFFKIYIFHSHWKKWISFLIWISIPFTVLIFIKINTIWVLNLSFSHPDSLQQYWSNVSFLFWPFYVYCCVLHAKRYEEDIWTEIAKHLDGKSLVMLGTTNKWFHCLIMEDSIWKFACLRDLQLPEPQHTFLNWIKLYASAFGNEQGVKFSPYFSYVMVLIVD